MLCIMEKLIILFDVACALCLKIEHEIEAIFVWVLDGKSVPLDHDRVITRQAYPRGGYFLFHPTLMILCSCTPDKDIWDLTLR